MTDQEIKDLITAELDARLKKVRIPELTENTTELDGTFKTVLYNPHNNKTQWESLQDLQTYFALGGDGTGSAGDAARTGRYIFQLSSSYAGQNTVSLPQYAGKNFTVRIDALDLLDSEYTVLNAGGFKVDIPGFTFQGGERITIDSGEPIADGSTPQVGGGLIKGTIVVSVNTSLSADDMRKLVQVRGGSTQITLTMPDIAAVSDNDYLFIETHLSNSKQQKISTTGGQSIYLNSTSKTALYLAPGEVLVLYRKTDGWYILNDFGKLYTEVGKPFFDWSTSGLNELELNGQEVSRADYPRLWEKVQTLGSALVSKATWQIASATTPNGQTVENPNRAKWHTGDGSTTFGLPDFRGLTVRGLPAAADGERTEHAAGNVQKNALLKHYHYTELDPNSNSDTGSGKVATGGVANEGDIPPFLSGAPVNASGITVWTSSIETRMDNAGIYWKIKV